jgi:hypothetical protein
MSSAAESGTDTNGFWSPIVLPMKEEAVDEGVRVLRGKVAALKRSARSNSFEPCT